MQGAGLTPSGVRASVKMTAPGDGGGRTTEPQHLEAAGAASVTCIYHNYKIGAVICLLELLHPNANNGQPQTTPAVVMAGKSLQASEQALRPRLGEVR